MLYICRSGCQCRLLPTYYGDWRAVHKRFMQWSKCDIWQQLFKFLQENPDMEWTMMDSTIVRAHACSAGYGKDTQQQEALGRSKGGFSTKIHAITDALGLPLKFILTPGQRNDITQAKLLSENISETIVVADKGYDANDFIESIIAKQCGVVIPPRKNRKVPREYVHHQQSEFYCFVKDEY